MGKVAFYGWTKDGKPVIVSDRESIYKPKTDWWSWTVYGLALAGFGLILAAHFKLI